MARQLLDSVQLQTRFGRTWPTIRSWRRRGCPGFVAQRGKVFGDPEAIAAWVQKTEAQRPGPKVMPEALGAEAA